MLEYTIFEKNTVWDILKVGIGFVCTGIVCWLVSRVFFQRLKKLAEKTQSEIDDLIIKFLKLPILLVIWLIGGSISIRMLHLGNAGQWVDKINIVLGTLLFAFTLSRFVRVFLGRYLIKLRDRPDIPVDDHIVVIVRKGLNLVIWITTILLLIHNLGFDVSSLLAGLGIGGLAVALAAKDTLANVFGGLVILTDKPFRIGDRVQFDGIIGIVETIGIRSVRLRADDGTIITVPNSKFVEASVFNHNNMAGKRTQIDIGLTYDTPAHRLEYAKKLALEIVSNIEGVYKEPAPSARYVEFASSSIILRIWFWTSADAKVRLEIQDKAIIALKDAFDKAGLNFAFPTVTIKS